MIRMGVVGDYSADRETHLATTAALRHAATALGHEADVCWVSTSELDSDSDAPERLRGFDGLLIAPGSPYENMEGALAAITFARTHDTPLLGTCGGFQHMVLEYAREVLDVDDAQHAEYDPYASRLFVTPLTCSLAGRQMEVEFLAGTRAARAYGARRATERYYCNFGLNPDYRQQLEGGGLVVSGVDQDDEARVIELPGHRFFVGTLFVPQTKSEPDAPHPLLVALTEEAARSEQGSPRGGSV